MKIIRISAIWCPACLVMKKVWKNIDTSKYEIIDYDYDMDTLEIEKYNVGKILPVYIFMNDDKEIKRIVGEISIDKLKKELDDINE